MNLICISSWIYAWIFYLWPHNINVNLRPQNLSQDYIQDFYVIKHALVNAENYYKKKFNLIVLLRPTSPFREHGLIEKSISLLINNIHSTSVRSVYKVSEHPYRSWIKKDKFITGFVNDVFEIELHKTCAARGKGEFEILCLQTHLFIC